MVALVNVFSINIKAYFIVSYIGIDDRSLNRNLYFPFIGPAVWFTIECDEEVGGELQK